jgi:hypothetical protein
MQSRGRSQLNMQVQNIRLGSFNCQLFKPNGRSGSFCGYCRSHCCPVLGSMADRIHFRRLEVYFDDALQSLRRAWH